MGDEPFDLARDREQRKIQSLVATVPERPAGAPTIKEMAEQRRLQRRARVQRMEAELIGPVDDAIRDLRAYKDEVPAIVRRAIQREQNRADGFARRSGPTPEPRRHSDHSDPVGRGVVGSVSGHAKQVKAISQALRILSVSVYEILGSSRKPNEDLGDLKRCVVCGKPVPKLKAFEMCSKCYQAYWRANQRRAS